MSATPKELPTPGRSVMPGCPAVTDHDRELAEVDLLSPLTIELATRNHTGEMPNSLMDYALGLRNWLPWPAYLGLGFFVRGEKLTPGPLPNLASARTYGGWGSGTSCFWVDPIRDVCFSLITVGALEDTDHLTRTQRLGDMVLASVVR